MWGGFMPVISFGLLATAIPQSTLWIWSPIHSSHISQMPLPAGFLWASGSRRESRKLSSHFVQILQRQGELLSLTACGTTSPSCALSQLSAPEHQPSRHRSLRPQCHLQRCPSPNCGAPSQRSPPRRVVFRTLAPKAPPLNF